MNTQVLFVFCLPLILIPQLRRLIFVIPLKVLITGRKNPLLGSNAMLIPSDCKVECPKVVLGNRLFEGIGFKLGTTGKFGCVRTNPLIKRLLVLGNNKIKAPLFSVVVAELIDLFEFMGGIDVHDRKGNLPEERLADEPEKGGGILSNTPEHSHIAELAVGLTDNKYTLALKSIQRFKLFLHGRDLLSHSSLRTPYSRSLFLRRV